MPVTSHTDTVFTLTNKRGKQIIRSSNTKTKWEYLNYENIFIPNTIRIRIWMIFPYRILSYLYWHDSQTYVVFVFVFGGISKTEMKEKHPL